MMLIPAGFLSLSVPMHAADIESGKDGRSAASVPGFEYSDALKTAKLNWDADTLNQWLADPEQLVRGN
jgi:cytochrome c